MLAQTKILLNAGGVCGAEESKQNQMMPLSPPCDSSLDNSKVVQGTLQKYITLLSHFGLEFRHHL